MRNEADIKSKQYQFHALDKCGSLLMPLINDKYTLRQQKQLATYGHQCSEFIVFQTVKN